MCSRDSIRKQAILKAARLEFEKHKIIKVRDQKMQYRRLLISIRGEGGS